MPIASFSNKIFEVNKTKMKTFNNFGWSIGLETEEQEKEGNKSSTYVKGFKLETINIDVILDKRFCNVESEINDWKDICNKRVAYYFILGKVPVIPNKCLLLAVEVKDTIITSVGKFEKATLGLKFQEYVREGHKETKGKDDNSKEANLEKIKNIQPKIDDLNRKRSNPAADDSINNGPLKNLTGLG